VHDENHVTGSLAADGMVRDGSCSAFASRRQPENIRRQIKLFFDNRSAFRGYMKIFIFSYVDSGACAFADAEGLRQSN
jgi:hypothetical protein